MIDWTKPMSQTFEYYVIDPNTWKDDKQLTTITASSITRDDSSDTRGSGTFDTTESVDECYIRTYLVVNQNGEKDKIALGTLLVQSPSTSFNGLRSNITLDGYTSLLELNDTKPPIGYSILKNTDIMSTAYALCDEKTRAPIIPAQSQETLYDDFVSNTSDTWLTFCNDLIANAKFTFGLDPLGQILFEPVQDIASLQSVWTYSDDNSSILYPDITDDRDLYSIPNIVEVIYSTDSGYIYSKVVNDDPESPVSTVTRGREVLYRETSPSFQGEPTQDILDQYAYELLRNLSCLEHTITYKHGYCPVTVGQCVTLNYKRANILNVKAKVISQRITCSTGCTVEETATYTTRLWR